MLNTPARTGETGAPGVLSGEILRFRNVHGNGSWRIEQDDHAARLKWAQQDRREPAASAARGTVRGPTTPAGHGGRFAEALAVPSDRATGEHGALGKTAGRPTGPVQFVWKLMGFWRLDKPDVARLLGYDPEDIEHVSAVLDGGAKLGGRDARDRIAHLFHIRRTLWSLFRDLDVENEWLREEHAMLDGKSPLSLMLAGSMEDLLLAREYVELAAGVR